MSELHSYLSERREQVNEHLKKALRQAGNCPPSLAEAMAYSLLAPGKRLRPLLVIMAAEACGGITTTALPAACAVEMIHTYSLIHDDLPAMDDDDYRRGRLTSHKVFGEAVAILAGDALLTLAFQLIARNVDRTGDARVVCTVLADVAEAAGTSGMVGGQVIDIESEGKAVSAETLDYIHTHKTAALIRVSLRAGAMLAGATPGVLAAITTGGDRLGLAVAGLQHGVGRACERVAVQQRLQHGEQAVGVGAGEEQDAKEAFLAYWALRQAQRALTKAEIDAIAEAFLRERLGLDLDFEISDALAKLERLGLVTREGETFIAIPPAEALVRLDAAWDGVFNFSARREPA